MIENNNIFSFPFQYFSLVLLHWLIPPEQIFMIAVIVASLLVTNLHVVFQHYICLLLVSDIYFEYH